MEYYLDFAEHMLLAFGFVFELPLFIGFLSLAGIVTPQQLVKFSRYAIVASFIVGAFVTPGPEISSQIAVSSALVGLYFLSVGIAFLIDLGSLFGGNRYRRRLVRRRHDPVHQEESTGS